MSMKEVAAAESMKEAAVWAEVAAAESMKEAAVWAEVAAAESVEKAAENAIYAAVEESSRLYRHFTDQAASKIYMQVYLDYGCCV